MKALDTMNEGPCLTPRLWAIAHHYQQWMKLHKHLSFRSPPCLIFASCVWVKDEILGGCCFLCFERTGQIGIEYKRLFTDLDKVWSMSESMWSRKIQWLSVYMLNWSPTGHCQLSRFDFLFPYIPILLWTSNNHPQFCLSRIHPWLWCDRFECRRQSAQNSWSNVLYQYDKLDNVEAVQLFDWINQIFCVCRIEPTREFVLDSKQTDPYIKSCSDWSRKFAKSLPGQKFNRSCRGGCVCWDDKCRVHWLCLQ